MHLSHIFQPRWAARLGVAAALLAVSAAPAQAAPGLPRTYDVSTISSPAPILGSSFGWGTTSADVTGDGRMDLLVNQSQGSIQGQSFVFDGATNKHIDTIDPPELNENGSPVILGFVYAEHMADIGSCPGGDGPDLDKICDATTVGGLDGRPEIIIGSRSLRVGPNGETGCTSVIVNNASQTCPTIGRGYVFDGASLGDGQPGVTVLKRLDMPPNHRESQRLRGASPQIGRAMTSPSGLPPCAGPASEANNAGVGPCPPATNTPGGVPPAVRIGDVDGDANSDNPVVAAAARADIIAGVRSYRETSTPGQPNTAAPGTQCATSGPAFNSTSGECASGKGFIFKGEQIAGSNPREILDGVVDGQGAGGSNPTTGESITTITNPYSQLTSSDVFGNLFRLGDVGACPAADAALPNRCATSGNDARNFTPDGRPEVVVNDAFLDYPLTNPDPTFTDVGGAYVFDGQTGRFRDIYENPEPEARSVFSHNFNAGWPTGNLGHSTLADFLTGAPAANVKHVGDGRAFVWNGEATASRGRLIGVLDDATPKPAGNFGSSYTGVGDLVDAPDTPANEVMIGSYAPFITSTEAAAALINDVHIFNATNNKLLQTIPDPAQEKASGFGMGVTPMGDLNGDGFLDFAITSYLSNVGGPAVGRAFIFRSNNKPLPPAPTTPGASVSTPTILRPGRCANDTLGTPRADRLKGTTAGDRMLGYGGDDRVEGFQDADCLDGGAGADRLLGAAGFDRLLGGTGNDRMLGGNDRDRLFGMSGRDRLRGGYGADVVAGGSGNDRLDGGPETDRIYGESGGDRIRAGGGRNFLDGGPGNDAIHARNDRRDVISCGSGRRDRVSADRTDRVRVDCERISRAKRRPKR